MPLTYTEAKATLDDIASRSEANRKRLEQARQLVLTAETDLNAMPAAYSLFASDLDAAVAANAGDQAWTTAGAEKDQMAADFAALKAKATAIKDAIDGV